MSKRLTKNYDDAESRRLWEAAEKAAANRRQLVVPEVSAQANSEEERNRQARNGSQSEDEK